MKKTYYAICDQCKGNVPYKVVKVELTAAQDEQPFAVYELIESMGMECQQYFTKTEWNALNRQVEKLSQQNRVQS